MELQKPEKERKVCFLMYLRIEIKKSVVQMLHFLVLFLLISLNSAFLLTCGISHINLAVKFHKLNFDLWNFSFLIYF